MSEYINLNRIYTWPLAYGIAENPEDMFKINNTFVAMLVQESAFEIIMPEYRSFFKAYYGEKKDFNDGLPNVFKKYVRIVDDSQLQSKVESFMRPILVNENPNYPESSNIVEGHRLLWAVVTLANSIKYKAQADINIRETKKQIDIILPKMTDDEAKYRLAAIAGIFNFYESNSIPIASIKQGHEHFVSEKLDEILNDEYFANLSVTKHNLGILDNQIESLKNIPINFNKFIGRSRIAKYLKRSFQNLSIAINTPIISISLPFSEIVNNKYNPVCISLENYRDTAISHIPIRLKSNDGRWVLSKKQ